MKKSCYAFRVIFSSVMIMAMSLSMIAQRSMSLGDLKFVLPSADMQMASRTFDIKMATTGITSSMFRKIGGVAFIQTAVPSFEIDGLELLCDIASNSASVAINDTVYELPLEAWQLQSIVNFADASGNAAVTLYGDEESLIKYHKAFIDNLMGLRLLQVDLNFTDTVMGEERGGFPAIDGEYIFSPKERDMYENGVYKDSIVELIMQLMKSFAIMYDTGDLRYSYNLLVDNGTIPASMSYETYSESVAKYAHFLENASYEQFAGVYYSSIVVSEGLKYGIDRSTGSYIYTDYGQSIKFSSIGQNIVFDGAPYYLFANSSNDGSEAKIDYMWTFVCKQKSDLIYLINPIVYDSAIKCCQWSAFFRYVKANYPDEWRSFKADVQRLRYDAPEVVTPINLHRDEP